MNLGEEAGEVVSQGHLVEGGLASVQKEGSWDRQQASGVRAAGLTG